MTGDEMQSEETSQQIASTNSRVELLRERQTELTRRVLAFAASRDELNAPIQKKLDELSQAQNRNRQEIDELSKAINNLLTISRENGNLPQE